MRPPVGIEGVVPEGTDALTRGPRRGYDSGAVTSCPGDRIADDAHRLEAVRADAGPPRDEEARPIGSVIAEPSCEPALGDAFRRQQPQLAVGAMESFPQVRCA
jgi:hypothetical protein